MNDDNEMTPVESAPVESAPVESAPEIPAEQPPSPAIEAKKFGTFKGVFLPSILTILGVVMYLRMGWVVGHAGLVGSIIVITLASCITFLTGLSIAATATNMKVQGGGAYFMISRSFGLEAGAAIGLPLYFAQALGISFYVSGFAESVNAVYPSLSPQITGLISLLLLTLLAVRSADLALKAQMFIFGTIIVSLISFALGHTPTTSAVAGPVSEVPFWAVFAVFFPAVTGIEAGISMSGDLKDPARSLPRGTLWAVVTGFVIYLLIAIALWNFADAASLTGNLMIMKDISLFAPAIFLGIWGASLSSGLGALLGGPRTLQALARDRVVPTFIGRGFGPGNEPRIATILTFIIAACGILFGDLNTIAPILSMFFLTSYGALNLIAGLEGMIGNPSWRPTFRTPWIYSLVGSLACLGAMLMIDPGSTFLALLFCSCVYLYMRRRDLNARWPNMKRGILLYLARMSIYKLSEHAAAAKTWRPNMLVLSGSPQSRWHLIELADAITHGKGFLTVCVILKTGVASEERLKALENSTREFLLKKNVPALVKVKEAEDVPTGIENLASDYGLGPLRPNTLVFGVTEQEDNVTEFVRVVELIHKSRKNTLIVRENSDPTRKPNSVKMIDVWWGKKSDNAALMLTYAYMLQTSQEWMGSRLALKVVVEREEERQGILANLREFIEQSRIEAEIDIYVKGSEESSFVTIRKYSRDADLIFIGMKAPEDDESTEEYSHYYEKLLENTANFPFTVITLAGENIHFEDIFT